MEKETIDRMTVAGLLFFLILGIIYLCRDRISLTSPNISLNLPAVDLAIPVFAIPYLSLEWFYKMDTASQIIFSFIMLTLFGTLIGCTLLYIVYRKQSDSR